MSWIPRLLLLYLLLPLGPMVTEAEAWDKSRSPGGLGGKILVANPRMVSGIFAQSVILVCRHDERGAFGVILNKPVPARNLDANHMPPWPMHVGGPVDPRSMFMLMNADDAPEGSLLVAGGYAIANPESILGAGDAKPPRHGVLVFGYSGWAPGQLESEMSRGEWVAVESDDDLVFGRRDETKWRRAISKRGQDL